MSSAPVTVALAAAAVAGWFDPDVGLLRSPDPIGDATHLTAASAWWAAGLSPGDDRSAAVVDALCTLQYDRPGTPWHGTFPTASPWPHPGPGATCWVDWDPNWRLFVGVSFALLLEAGSLPDAVAARAERAVALALEGEHEDRIPSWYTNPALLAAWLEAWWARRTPGAQHLAERAERRRAAQTAVIDATGSVAETNSPTYAGLDWLACALWQLHPPAAGWADDGARITASLAADWAERWHPPTAAPAGPYVRCYDLDLTGGLALGCLWLAAQGLAVPLPEAGGGRHRHDWAYAPLMAMLAPHLPRPTALAHAVRNGAPHPFTERHWVHGRATAALHGPLAVWGLDGTLDWGAHPQAVPYGARWAVPDGGIGWLRPRHVRIAHAAATPEGAVHVEASGGYLPVTLDIADPAATVQPGGDGDVCVTSCGTIEVTAAGFWETLGPGRVRWTAHGPDTGFRLQFHTG